MVWKHVSHPNVVPFKGTTLEPLRLVADWMPGGELRDYVKKNRDINLVRLVGPSLNFNTTPHPSAQLLGIAEGLDHIHSRGVIHGDLRGVRVITHIRTA